MSFSKMLEILKQKEKKKIVFVQCGHFYLAIEGDAVLLHEILGFKCTCFKNQVCKVGIPVGSLEKYLKELEKLKYAYVVYDFDRANYELLKKYEKEGKYHYLSERNINCLLCKGISKYKKDEYLEAITKLLKKEDAKIYLIEDEEREDDK